MLVPSEILGYLGETVVVSYGAGDDSTALLIDMVRREAFPPHAILFADTGGEKPWTYERLERVSRWLVTHGYPAVITLKKGGRQVTLEEDCLSKNVLPSVAYGYKSCSHKFKIEPQEKWCNNDPTCRQTWRQGLKVTKFIGYGAAEMHRVKNFTDTKYAYRYPNVDHKIDKTAAIGLCESEGLTGGKSSCFFCPNSTKEEILTLPSPLLNRALLLEDRARPGLTKIKGLGRRFAWRDFIMSALPEQFDDSESSACGCYE